MLSRVIPRGWSWILVVSIPVLLLGILMFTGNAAAGQSASPITPSNSAFIQPVLNTPIVPLRGSNNPYAPTETCPPGTPTRVPTPLFTPAPGCSDIPADGELSATISDQVDMTEAEFTNTSSTCSYRIGLATYRRFGEYVETQELFDYSLAVIPPNSSLTLSVSHPTCAYQGDAFYGDVIYSFVGGVRYDERRLDDTTGLYIRFCRSICSGTPVASNTPNHTNTLTSTGTPTPTYTSTSTSTSAYSPTGISTATRTRSATRTPITSPTNTPARDAYLALVPENGGPPNGGMVNVGDRFVLDLVLNAGSHLDTTAEQSYLTYTYDLIKNARVDQIDTACVLTSTVTSDHTTFEGTFQNEVCNGPGACVFRGLTVGPGSFAYASGVLTNPPAGGSFRVAQVGLCAVAPGRALLHWQFTPPAPPIRDTEIVVRNGDLVQNPALFADYVINIAGVTYTPTPTLTPGSPTATPTVTRTRTRVPTPVRDAFMLFVPQGSAPPNGGTATVGDRFVLELWLNAGSNNVTAQQSYLTYTYDLIKNARVSQIATACVLTSTVTADPSTFDATLQNEICNGPGQCNFRGLIVDPGSFAYSSGALSNCPDGCGGTFRVAQVGLCAVAPGQALLHWQFTPPAPATRDTEIITANGALVHDPALFTDYVINIVDPTSTPTVVPDELMVGHVTWQGRPAQPNVRQQVPISVSLSLGNTQVDYAGINTDANGFFTVTVGGLPSGNYTWRVKGYDPQWGGPSFLANSGMVALDGSPTTEVEMNLMRAGDANNDNYVTILDFNILKYAFGRPCNPCQDPRSDFNSDGVINSSDFNLLKPNFGTSGAP